MSTLARPSPAVVHGQHALALGLMAILILASLILITSLVLTIVSSTSKDQDGIQADPIPVVQNSITPIPVPMPPMADIYLVPYETTTPVIAGANKLSVLPVPVPTPPLECGA